MSDLQEVNFSDLLQRPNETVEKLKASRHRALRVHRRGSEDDLILTTVDRVAVQSQWAELGARTLRAVMDNPTLRSSHLLDILPQVFPWTRFLPTDSQIEFAQELVEVWEASVDLGVPGPVLLLIARWRSTAEAYADPE
jgi:hypothetical protein